MNDELVIEANRAERQYWKDLWKYRELFLFLAWRNILVRYKQTVIGVAWAVLRPLLSVFIFTLLLRDVAGLGAGGVAYPVMCLCGLMPWQFFAGALQESGNSLVANSSMVSKVYFPRLVIPASSVVTALVDFLISAVLLAGFMIYYQVVPSGRMVFLPLFVILAFASAFGVGVWVSALMVRYRDFRFVLPFVMQFGWLASPVGFMSKEVYEGDKFPEYLVPLFSLNPMVGVIDGFRWSILGGEHVMNWMGFGLSTGMVALLVFSGIKYFRATERTFADVI